MKDIKLVIFDWDGTLMDSVMHIVGSLKGAIETLNLESRNDEALKNIIGLGMREAIFDLFPDQDSIEFADRFTAAYREYFFAKDAKQALFPGALETLKHLKESQYQLAVATGKSRKGLKYALNETRLDYLFDESRCADETRSKPHPQMLQEILSVMNLEPEQAIMVGDTVYDLEMAKNAGMSSIGVNYGVHTTEQLEKFNPVCILNNIQELPELLASKGIS